MKTKRITLTKKLTRATVGNPNMTYDRLVQEGLKSGENGKITHRWYLKASERYRDLPDKELDKDGLMEALLGLLVFDEIREDTC